MLTVAIATVGAIATIEVSLRAVRVFPDYILFDAELGWTLRPGIRGWIREENAAWININTDGLFDHDHAVAKPPQTVRFAVLGDSYMSPLNLPFEQSFVSLLEGNLNRCTSVRAQPVEAINFGVPGYGTAQELLTYRRRVRAYTPDVVLLMMYVGNDVLNNHADLSPSDERGPFFVFRGDELQLIPPESWETEGQATPEERHVLRQQARLFVTRRSRAAALLYEVWGRLRTGGLLPLGGDRNQNSVYQPAVAPPLTDAWRVTEALLLRLAHEVGNDDVEFWLVTIPTSAQVDPSPATRRATAASYGVPSLSYTEDRIQNFAAMHGIRALSLLAPLADYSEETGSNLYGGFSSKVPAGSGHWNELGNRVAADAVASQLCAQARAIAKTE